LVPDMASARLALLKREGRPIFRRNPRIFPPAKSKLLRVREPRVRDPVETELLNKWWSDYRRQMAAIVDALRYCFESKGDRDSDPYRVNEKVFDEELIAINERWNAQTKLAREHYYFEDFNRKIAKLLEKREKYDAEAVKRMEALRAKTLSMEGQCKGIVTRENIDERLEEIMSSPIVQFNYAVSERGTIVHPKSSGDPPL
uniref:Small ribosomal subunit protein mS26 n=1 Tax=Hydatigena taeniaeformis TaxID=6205 RepID=A0A0R3WNF1_HYDTA